MSTVCKSYKTRENKCQSGEHVFKETKPNSSLSNTLMSSFTDWLRSTVAETSGDNGYKTRLYLESTGGRGGSGGWECWQKNLLYKEMRLCLNSILYVTRLQGRNVFIQKADEKPRRIVSSESKIKLNVSQVFKCNEYVLEIENVALYSSSCTELSCSFSVTNTNTLM